jgi:spore germination protein YaaH
VGATSAKRLPIMYAPPIPVTTRKTFHTIKRGETLYSIAKRYHVSVEDLKRWNGVSTAIAGKTLALEVRSAASKPKGKPRPQAKGKPVRKARTS